MQFNPREFPPTRQTTLEIRKISDERELTPLTR
jgi:hypothetical protein